MVFFTLWQCSRKRGRVKHNFFRKLHSLKRLKNVNRFFFTEIVGDFESIAPERFRKAPRE